MDDADDNALDVPLFAYCSSPFHFLVFYVRGFEVLANRKYYTNICVYKIPRQLEGEA
jgi:hypothetical protein